MSQALIALVCAIIAVSDLAIAAYFWKQAKKLQVGIDEPQAQASMKPEDRAAIAAKANTMRMTALSLFSSAFVIPAIAWFALTSL